MDDELFFSYVHRTAIANGFIIKHFLKEYVWQKDYSSTFNIPELSYGSINYIVKFANNIGYDPAELFYRTTLYPALAPTLGPAQQIHLVNQVFRGSENFPKIITTLKTEIKSVKLCKQCLDEEMKENGFFWYHRSHNLPGVCMCHKHQTPLVEFCGKYGEELENNEKNFVPIAVKYPNENLQYSIFAHDFLELGVDTDKKMIRKAFFDEIDIEMVLINYVYYEDKELFEFQPASFQEWKKDINTHGERSFWFMLVSYFIMFDNVELIPKRIIDIELHRRFLLAAENDYTIYAPYRTTLVTMKKKEEGTSFVTTPYGFLSGWRSPLDDIDKTDHQKFEELVHLSREGRYKIKSQFDSMNRKITLFDTKCGNDYIVRAGNFINYEVDCPCTSRITLQKLKDKIDDGEFILIDADLSSPQKTLTIHHRGGCGCTFEVSYRAWCNDPTCRLCNTIIHNGKLIKANQLQGKDTEDFIQDVKNLTGDEYQVCSKYVDAYTKVEIKHMKCGKSKMYVPVHFNRGERCDCQKWVAGEKFIAFVDQYSMHRYSVTRFRSSDYLVKDNTCEREDKILRKPRIIQELIRPTPSPILPLEEKDTAVSPYEQE